MPNRVSSVVWLNESLVSWPILTINYELVRYLLRGMGGLRDLKYAYAELDINMCFVSTNKQPVR